MRSGRTRWLLPATLAAVGLGLLGSPKPDDWIFKAAEQFRVSSEFQRTVSQHGVETTLMRGNVRSLRWSLAVRDTPVGLCLILYTHAADGEGHSSSCGIPKGEFVASRHGIQRRLTAVTFDESQHMVVGIAPKGAKAVRLRLGPLDYTLEVAGPEVLVFAQQVPCDAPDGTVEALDKAGTVIATFQLTGIATGAANGPCGEGPPTAGR